MFWHNQRAPDGEKILLGSVITDVGGTSGCSSEMRQVFDCVGELEVKVQPMQSLTIQSLSKRGKPLGLCLSRHPCSPVLVIREVQQIGAVAAWNAEFAPAGMDIRQGDHITSVNGIAGNIETMRQLISSCDVLDLAIWRPVAF